MAWRQAEDSAKTGPRRECTPIGKNLVQRDRIQLSANTGVSEYGFDFRTKDQAAAHARIKERPYAKAIAGEEEGAVAFVVNGDGELTVEAGQTLRSKFLVKV